MIGRQRIINFARKRALLLLLLLGILNGLIFIFLVPPWMHYDEPGHFEYVWLVANQPGIPERGDYHQNTRREIAASILEHDIESYPGMAGMTTDPLAFEQPITIWQTQVGDHPPIYYLMASLPLRIFKHTDITFQLYLVRLTSLILFMLIILVSYRASQALFGEEHSLTWMVPLFLVTLPSFVDNMTAANNDVAATLMFSLFVWISIELIKKGVSIFRLSALATTIFLCIITKSTAWVAAPLSLLVLLFTVFRRKKHWFVIGISIFCGLFVFIFTFFSWDQRTPAHFYSNNATAIPITRTSDITPVGKAVIVHRYQSQPWHEFYHLISSDDREALTNQTATLGAWIWSEKPTSIPFPGIRDSASSGRITFTNQPIELQTIPQFFAFSTEIPEKEGLISWIYFRPSTDKSTRVYWDGIVLVKGDFAEAPPPKFEDPDAQSGTWNRIPFDNLVQNASGESGWPMFTPWVYDHILSSFNFSLSRIMAFFDPQATFGYYHQAAAHLFRTFWGVFGWGTLPMFGRKPYRFFLALTFIYLIGLIFGAFKNNLKQPWQQLVFLVSVVLLQVMIVLVRGTGSWFATTSIPIARYFYPAILPLGMLLMCGADQSLRLINRTLRLPDNLLFGAYIFLQLGIMLWAILSITAYFS
jgi:hypothetical protein